MVLLLSLPKHLLLLLSLLSGEDGSEVLFRPTEEGRSERWHCLLGGRSGLLCQLLLRLALGLERLLLLFVLLRLLLLCVLLGRLLLLRPSTPLRPFLVVPPLGALLRVG